jgi:hypothetical protein
VYSPQLAQALPLMMVSVLERRYLADLQPGGWRMPPRPGDNARPLLREVVGLGRPAQGGEWARTMPHVLAACHDPGHALVLALHGHGGRHRLYLGGRRILGAGARSTADYLLQQESAFKAFFTGLRLAPEARALDGADMPEMAGFLEGAPTLAALTGIPSGRAGGLPVELQSLDRLTRAVGNHRYLLLVVAEPLDPGLIDLALDACRRLKSEVHACPRGILTRGKGGAEVQTDVNMRADDRLTNEMPSALMGLSLYCHMLGHGVGMLLGGLVPTHHTRRESHTQTRQVQGQSNWGASASVELVDANVQACEVLLEQHIARLQSARAGGWWRTAVYLAGDGEAAVHAVAGALRSLCGGESTSLDPIRTHFLPARLLREPARRGQVLSLLPAAGDQRHPLGEPFESLATCLNSDELAVLVNLPQSEIPGLPMRDVGVFALTAAPPAPETVELGSLQDEMGRGLGPVTLTAAALNRHVFVTGITGYGKTNTCMQVLAEAHSNLNGLPFLVIEPAKSEYRRLAQLPALKGRLRVYSIGGDSPLPFRLNPLSPVLDADGRPAVPLVRHIDRLKAVFNASFSMYGGMPQVLEQALLEVYVERGWDLYSSANEYLNPTRSPNGRGFTLDERSALMPSLQDLHDQIEIVLIRKGYSPMIRQDMGAVLRSRLGGLMRGNKGLMLNARRSTDLADLFEAPAVIELQDLGDDEDKAFLMALLFVLLYEYAEARHRNTPEGQRGKLRHLTLIEEAHRLLQAQRQTAQPGLGDPQGKAVAMFTDMLAEMRAYGEGFLIADQIPTKLAPETLKNSNLKIVHRLVAPDDREATGRCLNLNERQSRHLNNLAPGQAVVHDERVGEAVLVQVHDVKGTRARDLPDRELLSLLRATDPGSPAFLRRHAGCRSCPSPCDFYHRLESAANQRAMARALRPFLESLLLGDADAAWAEWSRWRQTWRARAQALHGVGGEAAEGVTYCAVTQAAYLWLGQLLADRNKVLGAAVAPAAEQGPASSSPRPWFADYAPDEPPKPGQPVKSEAPAVLQGAAPEELLPPEDRLRRESAARALGELFLDWVRKDEMDEPGRALFEKASEQLQKDVAHEPPYENPPAGCRQCPARCRMLPFVAPQLAKAAVSLKDALIAEQPPAERLLRLGKLLEPAEREVNLLVGRKDNRLRAQWRYCLLTNVDSAIAENDRARILDLLRPSAVDEPAGS